jgi:hypothetical protein
MAEPEQEHHDEAAAAATEQHDGAAAAAAHPGVIRRADGFFGVVGLPETTYYADEATAARVASSLDDEELVAS